MPTPLKPEPSRVSCAIRLSVNPYACAAGAWFPCHGDSPTCTGCPLRKSGTCPWWQWQVAGSGSCRRASSVSQPRVRRPIGCPIAGDDGKAARGFKGLPHGTHSTPSGHLVRIEMFDCGWRRCASTGSPSATPDMPVYRAPMSGLVERFADVQAHFFHSSVLKPRVVLLLAAGRTPRRVVVP